MEPHGFTNVLKSDAFARMATCSEDVFYWAGVSTAWKQRLNSTDIWVAVFTTKLAPDRRLPIRILADKIPSGLQRLSLDFNPGTPRWMYARASVGAPLTRRAREMRVAHGKTLSFVSKETFPLYK